MKHTIKKAFTLFLSLAMVLSLVSGIVPMIIPEAQAAETPDLVVGVLSDVHLGYAWDTDLQTPRFYKALKTYKAMGVDAIIIAGDLNDQGSSTLSLEGQKAYMEEFADVWFAVFPEEKGTEGYVEPVIIYGNHDVDLIAAGYWPERFGTYSNVQTWEVNGYQFVGAHNGKENTVTTQVADAVAATPDKPVFYIQHCPIAYTVGRSMGGYGSSYSLAGRNNISAYSNIVSFAGHNHMPLTDERSIWQGESWNDGQFTAINTASLNYGDADANEGGINGAGTATQHGMLMTVTGSNVSIERFSFEGLSVDMTGVTVATNSALDGESLYTNVSEMATKAVTGNYVKIGKTWSFDACDITDRPYTYSARVAAAKQPVFNAGEMTLTGAEVSDGTYTLTVTVPAATVANPSNGVYRDIVHNYIVEACDPLTGEVEAFASEASEFHIDDDPSRLSDSYTMQITGLQPGKTYTVNAYARETFQKRSAPLTATYTAGGTLTSFRTGDINTDGNVNEDDLTLLNKILAGEAAATSMVDVDGNKIVEKADATALENLLAGKTMVTDEDDLLSGATTPAWSSTTSFTQMQTAVTLGDSNVAYNSYAVAVSSWPDAHIYFEEPQDWSNKNVINFNILFENEYKVGDYTSPTRQVRFYVISGENKERSTGYLSRESFDADEAGWCQYSLYLNTLGNVDWSNVHGLLLDINYDGASNRFDGVTPHGFYLDNVTTSLSSGMTDDDILGKVTTVTGGKIVYNTGDTRDSYQAIKSTSSEMVVTLADSYKLSRFKELYFDNKLSGASTFTVQAMDASGNLLGKAVTVNSFNGWNKAVVSTDDMELDGNAQVEKLQFTTSGTLVIDNLSLTAKEDPNDLLATATMNSNSNFPSPDWFGIDYSCFTVNGEASVTSWRFINLAGSGWPTAIIDFKDPIDLENNLLEFDIKFDLRSGKSGTGFFRYYLLDEDGNALFTQVDYSDGYNYNSEGWATVQLDLSAYDVDFSNVRSLALRFNFDTYANVYVDNMQLKAKPDSDLIGQANSLSTHNTTGKTNISITDTVTNNSGWALMFDATGIAGGWCEGTLVYDTPIDMSASEAIYLDVSRTGSGTTFRLSLYDSEGNKVYYNAPNVYTGDWITLAFPLAYTTSNSTLTAVDPADLKDISKIEIQLSTNAEEITVVDNMVLGEMDDDLISAAGSISGDYSTVGVSSTETNNSSLALSMRYNNNTWPHAYLNYGEAVDLSKTPIVSVDVKRLTTKGDFKLIFYNSEGIIVYNPSYTVIQPGEWTTITYDLSALDATLIKDITKIEVLAYVASGDTLLIDNLYVTGLDDPDDLMNGAAIGSSYALEGTNHVYDPNSDVVNGSTSTRSHAFHSYTHSGWPIAVITPVGGLDLSTKYLQFDIKFENAEDAPNATGYFRYQFYDENGNSLLGSIKAYAGGYTYNDDGWATITLSLLDLDIDRSKVYSIGLGFDHDSHSCVYIDNMKYVAMPASDNDIFDSITVSSDTTAVHTLLVGDDTNGSNNAIELTYTAGNTSWPSVDIYLDEALDLSEMRYLQLDGKLINKSDSNIYVILYNGSTEVWRSFHHNWDKVNGYQTYEYDLTWYRNQTQSDGYFQKDGSYYHYYTNKELLKGIDRIRITTSAAGADSTLPATVLIDNIAFIKEPVLDVLGTGTAGSSGTLTAEIRDLSSGEKDVLCISDPEDGTNAGWSFGYAYTGYSTDANKKFHSTDSTRAQGMTYLRFKLKTVNCSDQLNVYLYNSSNSQIGFYKVSTTANSDGWIYYQISADNFGVTDEQLATVNRIGFQLSYKDGSVLYVDDLYFGGDDDSSADADLIGQADKITYSSYNWYARYNAGIVTSGTNNSANALYGIFDKSATSADAQINFMLHYSEGLTTSGTPNLTFDMKFDSAVVNYSIYLYDAEGNVLYSKTDCAATADGDYHTYTHNIGELSGVAQIKINTYLGSDQTTDRQVWIDNVYLVATE